MRRQFSRFVPPSATVSHCALAALFALSGCAAEPREENEASALGNNEAGVLSDGAAPPTGSTASTDGGTSGSSSTDAGGSGSGNGQGSTTRDGGNDNGGGSGTLDGGARADGGSSGTGGSGCALTPNEDGWVAAATNGAHVQGAFFTYQSTGSTITPLTTATAPFTNSGDGKLCVKGSAAKVLNMDFSTYYGAGLGFDLCQADAMSSTKHTIGQCPLGQGIGGIRFTLSGASIPSELRVSFHEAGRDESTYVLAKAGSNEALFKDGTVAYNMAAPKVNVGNIDSVHFMIPTNELDAVPFDFCIEKVEAVMASGSCEGGGASDGGTLDAGDGGGSRDAGSSDAGRDAGSGSNDAGNNNSTSCSKTNAWTTTAQFGTRNYGKYTLRNNFWNQGKPGAGSQTLWGNSERCWGVDSNHSDAAPKGTVKSYPNLQRGWGIGTAGFPNSQHGLAIQVSQLSKAKIRWSMQAPISGRTWALWDIYFHESANPGADKAPVNLMIQQRIVDSDGWMQQDSSSWPKVTIAGVTFREKRETNTVSSTRTRIQLYVDGENGSVLGRDDMALDLKAVIDHYVQANLIRANDYLTSIQAGFEIVSGGTYQTNEFWTAVQSEPDGP